MMLLWRRHRGNNIDDCFADGPLLHSEDPREWPIA
jgi:hypothetical protein